MSDQPIKPNQPTADPLSDERLRQIEDTACFLGTRCAELCAEVRRLRAENAELTDACRCVQRLQPGGSPPGGGFGILVPWIVRSALDRMNSLAARVNELEAAARDRLYNDTQYMTGGPVTLRTGNGNTDGGGQ